MTGYVPVYLVTKGYCDGPQRAPPPRGGARLGDDVSLAQLRHRWTRDLVEAMRADWSGERSGESQTVLRIDGGMVANDWAMQTLANQLLAPVDRPVVTETTASGAAYLAGLAQGICAPPDEFAKNWRLERRFEPQLSAEEADKAYAGWQDAIAKLLH